MKQFGEDIPVRKFMPIQDETLFGGEGARNPYKISGQKINLNTNFVPFFKKLNLHIYTFFLFGETLSYTH